MTLAPIVCFVYCRPELTRTMLESLASNELASESELFIYADGPKPNADERVLSNIREVRKLIREKQWCKNVTLIESDSNKGLATSVIEGVTNIVNRFGKIIVIEDDALLSNHFLKYMNDALSTYENDRDVFSIGSWSYFIRPEKLKQPYFFRFPDSVTWATYKRSWDLFEPDAKIAKQKLIDRNLMQQFNAFEKLKYFEPMLDLQIEGKINSWAIRWTATAIINGGLVLYPPISMSKNIGIDSGDGTHENYKDYNSHLLLSDSPIIINKENVIENSVALKEFQRFIKNNFIKSGIVHTTKQAIRKFIPDRFVSLYHRLFNIH